LLEQLNSISGEIIHDLEFILNFNPDDEPSLFAQISECVSKITSSISFEITVYGGNA